MTKLEEKLNALEKESNDEFNMNFEFVLVLKALRKAIEQRNDNMDSYQYEKEYDTEILKILGE